MSTQAELVKVVQTESERLKQYLAALPQDAWTKPSACALWEVGDVVAHLTTVPNTYTTGHITRALRGDTSPPAGGFDPSIFKTHSQEERRQWRAALAQRPITNRERFGNDLLSRFGQNWDHFHHFIATLSAQDWHKPC
jgi:Mycothiol maleylpyruvate isomerase N-terminal domain